MRHSEGSENDQFLQKRNKFFCFPSKQVKNSFEYFDCLCEYEESLKSGKVLLQHDREKQVEIKGWILEDKFLNEGEQKELWNFVHSNQWETGKNTHRRRLQHYGWGAEYDKGQISKQFNVGEIPEVIMKYVRRAMEEGLIRDIPDQVLVCEYQPGMGIGYHVDREDLFGDEIFAISLGSSSIFKLRNSITNQVFKTSVNPGSLYRMRGEARHIWEHGVSTNWSIRKKVKSGEGNFVERISLTFRTLHRECKEEQFYSINKYPEREEKPKKKGSKKKKWDD